MTIQHGKIELRLRLVSEVVARGPRPYHLVVGTVEVVTGARVELSLPDGELLRFGLD